MDLGGGRSAIDGLGVGGDVTETAAEESDTKRLKNDAQLSVKSVCISSSRVHNISILVEGLVIIDTLYSWRPTRPCHLSQTHIDL